MRQLVFAKGSGNVAQLKISGKSLVVSIGAGLPKETSRF